MKVKVNIMNMRCNIMSEAVTIPSLMMMTSIVSEESLARDTQTDRQTDTHAHTHTHAYTHTQTQGLFQGKTLKTKTKPVC